MPSSLQRCAGGKNDAAGDVLGAVGCGDPPAPVLRREARDLRRREFGARRGGLFLRDRAKIVAGDAIGKARISVDLVDAEKLPAEHAAHHKRAVAEPRARQRGRQAGNARSRDHHVEFTAHRATLALC